jgi:hypothetical protein
MIRYCTKYLFYLPFEQVLFIFNLSKSPWKPVKINHYISFKQLTI